MKSEPCYKQHHSLDATYKSVSAPTNLPHPRRSTNKSYLHVELTQACRFISDACDAGRVTGVVSQ